MQGGYRHAAQTSRYALDRSRFQRHHRSSLLKNQWSFSGLLGTPGRMTHHFLVVHPVGIEKVRIRMVQKINIDV
jgi:hypothetical protein